MNGEFVKWYIVYFVLYRVYMKCEVDKVKVENVGDGKKLVLFFFENFLDVGRCKYLFLEIIF